MIEKILNKISKYDLLIRFVPGTVCVFLINKISKDNLLIDNIIIDIGIIYFLGFMCEVLGSFFIKGICETVAYDIYIKADKRDNRIQTISRNIDFAEGIIGNFLITLLYIVLKKIYFENMIYIILFSALLILVSYAEKEIDFLKKRVNDKKKNGTQSKKKNDSNDKKNNKENKQKKK